MTNTLARWIYLALLAATWACSPSLPDDVAAAYQNLPDDLDYNLHVKPILSDKCFACHGPDKAKQKADLRLDIAEAAYTKKCENGLWAIDPGDLKDSEVFHRILSSDPDYMMPEPTSHLTLTAQEKATLIKWIEEGAAYQPHWAFVKPQKPDVPDEEGNGWAYNEIDRFIIDTQKENRLIVEKRQQADKETLLRRLSLDLTGLPPSIADIDAFLKDQSPNAYQNQVDRLLKSPHFGEKMATDWLDLARFADSHGYTVDRLRDMSPYRDWVIAAFNQNMPYDRFIHWQLAGDLMKNPRGGPPTKEMRIATAFNRNHQQNMEGGIVEAEFQTEYVVDRTNTFGDAFMGLSVGCARCHDHKYDPISQKDYYQLFSFFNNVREAGQISWDDALPTPTMLLPTTQQEQIIAFLNAQIKQQEAKVTQAQALSQIPKGFSLMQNTKVGLVARYDFDDKTLTNKLNPTQKASMKREAGEEPAQWIPHGKGTALSLNGDVWLDLNGVGAYRRSEPFSVGIWVQIPRELKEGVIIHKSQAERLYNFRGWHLYLKNDRLELNMAHTAPSDAITKISQSPVPRDRWLHLTITYDGSSKAQGLRLYLDGAEAPMQTVIDQLNKDIVFKSKQQPGVQVGAWWRGWGLTGGMADDLMVYNRALTPFEIRVLAQKKQWNEADAQDIRTLYATALDPAVQTALTELKRLRTALADSIEKVKEIMVMQEMPHPKRTYVLQRGNYDAPAEEVFPNTPASILAFGQNLPKNRYGLAQWLTHPDHPLTARVAVNRYWQLFFGTGLVKTTEDFGNQGALPSHPKLLDWLAVTFRESGWDLKKLVKTMVMSATYRQSTHTTKALREADPENRWLARGPSVRLSAEMLRDNALAASGLLQPQIGGPSVKPYQPDGLWQINNTTYVPDSGEAVYRRSLYVLVKRSVPNPTLSTFDVPSRSFCVVRRQQTNTPLQALVTLNDPTFVEAAKVMGEQTAPMPLQQSIVMVYRKLTGRKPNSQEIKVLTQLHQSQYQKMKVNPLKTKGWLGTGQYKINPQLDPALVAANAIVASTIMNSDATLMKR